MSTKNTSEKTEGLSRFFQSVMSSARGLLRPRFLFMMTLASVSTVIIYSFNFYQAEFFLYDMRFRIIPTFNQSKTISIVAIDKPNMQARGNPSAMQIRKAAEVISASKPKLIIFDLPWTKIPGTKKELSELAEYLASLKNAIILSPVTPSTEQFVQIKQDPPFDIVPAFWGDKTQDGYVLAQDKVTRRIIISYIGIDSIYPIAASYFNPEIIDRKNIRGVYKFLDADQALIDYRRPSHFPTFDFYNVVNNSFYNYDFRDRAVIVGYAGDDNFAEYIIPVYSRKYLEYPRYYMHAVMLDTLIRNNGVLQTPEWLQAVLVFVFALLGAYCVLYLRLNNGVKCMLVAAVAYSLLACGLFVALKIWIPMATVLIALSICFYVPLPYQLLLERRRSWEYQEKHRLLGQVEELKSNFISMMSHDLKTPIARIKGMTDLITNGSSRLDERQLEAVKVIHNSSDDLLKFFEAILSYSTMESGGVKLRLQAKDINLLIVDVVQRCEFMAHEKSIKISTQLEPLFPIKIDPNLIQQVIGNLIENAIKYSPIGSKIMVHVYEHVDRILIEVADNGGGIAPDDLPHLFNKFFRSKNVKSSPVKGSGLGLYLAKYFVELHNGHISVKSIHGKGTTFTVELPIESDLNLSDKANRPQRQDQSGSSLKEF